MKVREPLQRLMLKTSGGGIKPRDFVGAIRAKQEATQRPGLIAEVKKASPSRGVIQANFNHVKVRPGIFVDQANSARESCWSWCPCADERLVGL